MKQQLKEKDLEETNKLKAIHWRPNSSKADYIPIGNYSGIIFT